MISGSNTNFIKTDASYCRFGAEALEKLVETIEAQIEGVEKNEDIEYVHKMRVSSRRIRAAMPLFEECFPKKRYKKWLCEIKNVTKSLGAARDTDVQILFVKDYIKQLQPTEQKTGMEALLQEHINQRASFQPSIVSGLEGLRKSRVLQQVTSCCKGIIKEAANAPFDLDSVREKAFWHISSRLDDFLALEDYVYKENEIIKHHEMRIKAKWLRYTMEAFAPLYPDELSEEIKMMKNFQDNLGEMHDCDVWIETIPKFMEESKKENAPLPENGKVIAADNQDLVRFLDYIKEKRGSQYRKFVSYWDENKSKNAFEELRKNASAGFSAASLRTKAELANPYVKIGVIADVHANLNALETVFKNAKERGITVFLNAGDLIGFGAFPNEVIEALYSKNTLSVIGNFDLEVLDKNQRGKGVKKFSLEYARKVLMKSQETYLRSLPFKIELEIAHKKLLVTHGTPNIVNEHLYRDAPDERFQEIAKTTGADIIIFGHTHEQFTKKIGETLFINPGSVGRPGDGNPQAAYAAVTVSPFSIELIRVSYDVEAAAEGLRKRGAPESYAQMLLRGLSLDDIIAEDKKRENDMQERCPDLTKNAQVIAQKYCPDMGHSEQVKKLSLELFDSLQDLHKLGKRERCWLECAAILHDVGLAKGAKGHQKNTLKLILNDTQLEFSSVDRQVIANVARYHRNRGPKNKDYDYMSLSAELRRKVRVLAGILRLADALDFSHRSIVEIVRGHMAFEYVTIEAVVRASPLLEESAINKKKDMFELLFKKKVTISWKQIQPPQQKASEFQSIPREPAPVDGTLAALRDPTLESQHPINPDDSVTI